MNLTAKRAVGFIIDVFFVTLVGLILSYIFKTTEFWVNYGIGALFAFSRDILCGGRSLGKIIMGLRVVDTKTDVEASIWKLIVRNITTPLWVVDAIIVFTDNSKPRLMDRVLGLKVINK